ncbi:MAG: metal-sulfur cluster assembly factor [Thermomicrobiales bacterium]|nr:metal-sulfur cluster assembly factor [Thermomicrobiales bacterium]
MTAAITVEERTMEALHSVIDPELGINVVDLGLIYGVAFDNGCVCVTMTLTTPGCPLHGSISEAVHTSVEVLVPEAETIHVNLVWDPPWCTDRITEAGLRELGWC